MPYYGAQPPAPPSKPSGLYKALGIVMSCLGLAGVLWAFVSIGSLVFVGSYAKSGIYGSEVLIFGSARSAMAIVTGVMLATSGFGIFRAKKWARVLALAYAGLSLFVTFTGAAVNILVVQPRMMGPLHGMREFELITYVSEAVSVVVASALPIVVIALMLRAQAKQELDA